MTNTLTNGSSHVNRSRPWGDISFPDYTSVGGTPLRLAVLSADAGSPDRVSEENLGKPGSLFGGGPV